MFVNPITIVAPIFLYFVYKYKNMAEKQEKTLKKTEKKLKLQRRSLQEFQQKYENKKSQIQELKRQNQIHNIQNSEKLKQNFYNSQVSTSKEEQQSVNNMSKILNYKKNGQNEDADEQTKCKKQGGICVNCIALSICDIQEKRKKKKFENQQQNKSITIQDLNHDSIDFGNKFQKKSTRKYQFNQIMKKSKILDDKFSAQSSKDKKEKQESKQKKKNKNQIESQSKKQSKQYSKISEYTDSKFEEESQKFSISKEISSVNYESQNTKNNSQNLENSKRKPDSKFSIETESNEENQIQQSLESIDQTQQSRDTKNNYNPKDTKISEKQQNQTIQANNKKHIKKGNQIGNKNSVTYGQNNIQKNEICDNKQTKNKQQQQFPIQNTQQQGISFDQSCPQIWDQNLQQDFNTQSSSTHLQNQQQQEKGFQNTQNCIQQNKGMYQQTQNYGGNVDFTKQSNKVYFENNVQDDLFKVPQNTNSSSTRVPTQNMQQKNPFFNNNNSQYVNIQTQQQPLNQQNGDQKIFKNPFLSSMQQNNPTNNAVINTQQNNFMDLVKNQTKTFFNNSQNNQQVQNIFSVRNRNTMQSSSQKQIISSSIFQKQNNMFS